MYFIKPRKTTLMPEEAFFCQIISLAEESVTFNLAGMWNARVLSADSG